MAADLILINGIPGSGKSTLTDKLQQDLGLPALRKDFLKEALFDELGVRDRQWSRLLGRIVSEWQYSAVEAFLSQGESLIAESAFFKEFAAAPISESVQKYGARCIELYCETDPDELVRRFNERRTDGTRHAGHADAEMVFSEALLAQYAPLEIGTTIHVDTTDFGEAEYQALLTKTKGLLDA